MTKKTKNPVRKTSDADQLAEWLEEMSLEWCMGGHGQPYPDVATVVAGHVIVAGLDAGKEYSAPTLDVYDSKQVSRWVARIRTFRKENPECSLYEAIGETQRS